MSEKVLVVPTNLVVKDGNPIKVKQLQEIIDRDSLFLDREQAEKDPSYLQIIPYVIVRYMKENVIDLSSDSSFSYEENDFIFTYQRLKKGTEARLHSKFSIGVGGHINPVDSFHAESRPDFDTVLNCALREISEELCIEEEIELTNLTIASPDLIYDPTNDVGKVHIGILFTYESTTANIIPKEKEKISGSLISIKDLNNRFNKDPNDFEMWSQLALKELDA